MVLIYWVVAKAYLIAVHIVALFSEKARFWVEGRRNWTESLTQQLERGKPTIWFHCASLGEFEQGRPVIEAYKKNYPNHQLLLTFFSPSGYRVRKDYAVVDCVSYLPMDGPANAKRFLEIVQPDMAVFVKYEFWFFYLRALKRQQIPHFVISAIFRPTQYFFGWMGAGPRKMLRGITHIFVQNETSVKLLEGAHIPTVTLSGDTRFDRVHEIAENQEDLTELAPFLGKEAILVAGSTWPGDEKLIKGLINRPLALRYIIAPHEIQEAHLQELEAGLKVKSVRLSKATADELSTATVLIVDSIGLLSKLYRYGDITYVGGGFGSGIHNLLEAAAHEKPVLFGPRHEKFQEAHDLLACGGGFTFSTEAELRQIVESMLQDLPRREQAAKAAKEYVQKNIGATNLILAKIQGYLPNS